MVSSYPAVVTILFSILVSSGLQQLAAAAKFTVGDGKMWNPGVNYTIWEQKHRPFHIGDWLVFLYQKGQANVIQVDERAYNKCDASHPITNYSKGRSYAFQLNDTKHYYFICSYGHCYQGMKLAIKAEPLPPPSPPPSAAAANDKSNAPATAVVSAGATLPIMMLFSVLLSLLLNGARTKHIDSHVDPAVGLSMVDIPCVDKNFSIKYHL